MAELLPGRDRRLRSIASAEHVANRAAFQRTMSMLEFAEDCRVEFSAIEGKFAREAAMQSIFDDLSLALGWSVRQVQHAMFRAQTVRHGLPLCWLSFRDGHIGERHIYELAHAANQLSDPAHLDVLDVMAHDWLQAHRANSQQARTIAEFRQWLSRRIHRLEPEEHETRARQAQSERKVRITHRDDGLSELWALLPTPLAAAISQNLRKVRASQPTSDERTKDQWEADHVVDQLLCEPTGGEGVTATIGVLIPVTSLAGVSDQPGTSFDGSWELPAEHCDTDHIDPYDSGGSTKGANAQKLCRRHHKLKGHRMLPTPHDPPDRDILLDLYLRPLWRDQTGATELLV